MDYRDFTERNKAFTEFVQIRRNVLDSIDTGNFGEVFTEVCTKALLNDCVAQDVVAYFFNKGVPDYLYPNYEYYMSWQILAGANGNEFALEKMEFFLKPALDYIVDDDEIIRTALIRRNINKRNALMVISNLICEGIVDELQLNPKNLIAVNSVTSVYSPEKNRPFATAMENCIPKVIEFLIS